MRIRTRIILGFFIIVVIGFYFLVDWIVDDMRRRYLEGMEEYDRTMSRLTDEYWRKEYIEPEIRA